MECNGPQCSTSQSSGSQECDSCNDCECPGCTGQDVLKFTEIMWHKAAMAAMLEAKKDRIKSSNKVKIRKTIWTSTRQRCRRSS